MNAWLRVAVVALFFGAELLDPNLQAAALVVVLVCLALLLWQDLSPAPASSPTPGVLWRTRRLGLKAFLDRISSH